MRISGVGYTMWCVGIIALVAAARAPAPVAKPEAVFAVTPGDWLLEWNGSIAAMPLGKDGSYAWSKSWVGIYRWEPKTKTLFVREWVRESSNVCEWHVALDEDGKGISAGTSFAGTRVYVYKHLLHEPAPKPTD